MSEVVKPDDKIYFHNLDGLRFFSFLVVFFFHILDVRMDWVARSDFYLVMRNIFRSGYLGVNFFFVLSGFLITFLLLQEVSKTNGINIRGFYIRRILRIWPLFYLTIAIGFFVFPYAKSLLGQVPSETANISQYLLFINNFDVMVNGIPDSSILTVLWSVAVEEQFYLFWPLIIAFTPARYFMLVFSCIALLSLSFRVFNLDNFMVLSFHTISVISDMCIGGIVALYSYNNRLYLKKINPGKVYIVLLYLLIICFYHYRKLVFVGYMVPLERVVFGALFGLVIMEQAFSEKPLINFGKSAWIRKLGQISYGLYCFHMIGILISALLLAKLSFDIDPIYETAILKPLIAFIITLVMASLSYFFIEKRLLQLKSRF